MRVKKFEAKSMKDALRMVKAELGPEAVILGARENKRSFGIAGETSFEVTAAVSESTLQKKRFVESRLKEDDKEKFRTADARAQRRMIEKMVDKRTQSQAVAARQASDAADWRPRPITKISYIDIQDEAPAQAQKPRETAKVYAPRAGVRQPAQSLGQTSVQASAAAVKPAPKATRPPASIDGIEANRSGMADVRGKIRSLAREAFEAGGMIESAPPKATVPTTAVGHSAGQNGAQEIISLKSEIHRLQSLLEGFQKVPQTFQGAAHPGAEFGLGYDFSRCYQKLVEAGVAGDLAAEILTRASQEIDSFNAKKPAIVEAWVAKWLLHNISVCTRPLAGKVHVFVGPMGGGKTSQLVKTAAQLVIREKKKVAIVTTDTSKVGAVDQLKIYCQILNVPFAIIRDRSEWEWLESQLGSIDHVLIDSPGLGLRDMDEIQKIRSLMPSAEGAAIHLCLSSSMKESDALEVVRRFRVVQPTDLVFTALDLSVQHGVIATVQLRSGLPIHSFGIGARVPEDFEVATKERVLDLLFKLSSLKRTTEK
ncbi:MAG: flagellar biosynthesis protein FlhF [Deltaproteobacteria bacterium]|nr:flagellar biosynthesis protein FlhF [Deltaproteobacteria bacterium]